MWVLPSFSIRAEMVQRLTVQDGVRLSGMGLRNVEMVMEV